jgi:hypothetical protein
LSERDRLMRMLKRAARSPQKRKIVCYDATWAGLPRITVYDPPSRRKAGGRKRVLRTVPARPIRLPRAEQLELQL